MRTSNPLRLSGPVLAIVALMCVAGAQRWNQLRPPDTEEYQARVRAAWAEARTLTTPNDQ